jgi:hypothetical protein
MFLGLFLPPRGSNPVICTSGEISIELLMAKIRLRGLLSSPCLDVDPESRTEEPIFNAVSEFKDCGFEHG